MAEQLIRAAFKFDDAIAQDVGAFRRRQRARDALLHHENAYAVAIEAAEDLVDLIDDADG